MFSGADASKATKWDFGQVFLLLIWLPACYQLALAVLVSMKPPKDEGIVRSSINILHRIVEMLCKYLATLILAEVMLISSRRMASRNSIS